MEECGKRITRTGDFFFRLFFLEAWKQREKRYIYGKKGTQGWAGHFCFYLKVRESGIC